MLNFVTTFKDKNDVYVIDANCNLSLNGRSILIKDIALKPRTAVGLAEAFKNTIESQLNNNIFSLGFLSLVSEIKLLNRAIELLKEIRIANITNYNSKFNISVEYDALKRKFYSGYGSKKYSLPELEVLEAVSEGDLGAQVCPSDFYDKYHLESRDTSNMIALASLLKSFPYGGYTQKSKEILEGIDAALATALNTVTSFEDIANKAGDEIVIWSSVKISREVNTYKGDKWQIRKFIEQEQELLIAKGVEVKKPKVTKSDLLSDRFLETKNMSIFTQDELLKLFKMHEDKAKEVVPYMDWNNIKTILESNLVCVRDKRESLMQKIVSRAIGTIPREELSYLIQYIECNRKYAKHLSLSFVEENLSLLSDEVIVGFFGSSNEVSPSDSSYVTRLSKMSLDKVLNTNSNITLKYALRLDEEEKIAILPRLVNRYREEKENSIRFIMEDYPWDSVEKVEFSNDLLPILCDTLEWSKVRETILANDTLLKYNINNIIKNKDAELAKALALSGNLQSHSVRDSQVQDLFALLSKEDTMNIIASSTGRYYDSIYERHLNSLFKNESDLLLLLEKVIENGNSSNLMNAIAKLFSIRNYSEKSFSQVLLNSNKSIAPEKDVVKFINKETRAKLVFEGRVILDSNRGYSSYAYRHGSPLETFLEGITREDLESIGIIDFTNHQYALYLGKLMTDQELVECCEKLGRPFIHINVNLIPYSYLKKFESKKAFKELVGDQRKNSNSNLAHNLTKRFKSELQSALAIQSALAKQN